MLYQRLAQQPLRGEGAVLTPLADLVLLLSPAIPAEYVNQLNNLSAADYSVLPPIIAITSENDVTLRLAFPLGQWLENPRAVSGANSDAKRQAMGVYKPLNTHRLALEDNHLTLVAHEPGGDAAKLLQVSASVGVMQGHKDIANPHLVDFIAGVTSLQMDNRLSHATLSRVFSPIAPLP